MLDSEVSFPLRLPTAFPYIISFFNIISSIRLAIISLLLHFLVLSHPITQVSFLLIFLFKLLYQDSRIWSTHRPRLKRELHRGAGSWLVIPSSSFPDIHFPWVWQQQGYCWLCFPKGQEGRTRFTLWSYPQTLLTRIRWQIAISEDNSLHPQFCLWSTHNSQPVTEVSHVSHTLSDFVFVLLSYWQRHPSILLSLPLPNSIFLVPIYHKWKRNTNVILSSSTYLVPQARDKLHREKLHIQGTHVRIIWDLHHAVSWHSQSWRNMKLLCLICLFVGQWAAPQCQHVVVPPGVISFHEMLNIFRAMPPPNLCHSVLVRDFWLDVNIGHQQISLWYHLPSSFRHCSPVAFWSTAHSKAHLTYIIYLYYPINHSSWCSVTQPLIKAKSWFSCNIIIYKQIYK